MEKIDIDSLKLGFSMFLGFVGTKISRINNLQKQFSNLNSLESQFPIIAVLDDLYREIYQTHRSITYNVSKYEGYLSKIPDSDFASELKMGINQLRCEVPHLENQLNSFLAKDLDVFHEILVENGSDWAKKYLGEN